MELIKEITQPKKLELIGELAQVTESKSEDDAYDREIKRIANMVTTIARASRNSTEEIWDLLIKEMQKHGGVYEEVDSSLRARFNALKTGQED